MATADPAYNPTVSSGSGAPTTSTYLVQVADAGLSAEQAMGALATGITKNTTTTGVQSIAVANTDYLPAIGAAIIDDTGLTTTVPLLVKNGNTSGSGVEVQVSGTAKSGYLLRDSAGTQKGVLGYAVAGNDWLTGSTAGGLALSAAGALLVDAANTTVGVTVQGGSASMTLNNTVGARIGFGGSTITFASVGTMAGPLAISSSNSLTAVACQVTGDANTGHAQVGGADTISAVCGGVELWRGSATLLLVNGKLSIPTAQTQATIGANGGAAALTVLPVGYVKVDINGAAMIVPYYNA